MAENNDDVKELFERSDPLVDEIQKHGIQFF